MNDIKLYKKPYLVFSDFNLISIYCATTRCNGKCKKDNPIVVCQNEEIREKLDEYKEYSGYEIYNIAKENKFCEAILFSGLDPLDDFENLITVIKEIRELNKNYPIAIYTGYTEDEIKEKIDMLRLYSPIYLKVGRYIPNRNSIVDKVTGVKLISDNQYFIKL